MYVCMYVCIAHYCLFNEPVCGNGIKRHNLSPYLHFTVPSGNKLPTCFGLQSYGANPFRLSGLLNKCAPSRWSASWQIPSILHVVEEAVGSISWLCWNSYEQLMLNVAEKCLVSRCYDGDYALWSGHKSGILEVEVSFTLIIQGFCLHEGVFS